MTMPGHCWSVDLQTSCKFGRPMTFRDCAEMPSDIDRSRDETFSVFREPVCHQQAYGCCICVRVDLGAADGANCLRYLLALTNQLIRGAQHPAAARIIASTLRGCERLHLGAWHANLFLPEAVTFEA